MIIHNDCIHFKGDVPCTPHKEYGYHCPDCPVYSKIGLNILIIKLGAIGDVIRTTPVLRKMREIYPDSYITWLTYSPEMLSKNWVNRILNVTPESLELVRNIKFDWLINLDKDPLAISLTKSIDADKKSGFTIDEYGHTRPIQSEAEEHKWLTGLFDDLNKANTRHYVEEMFDICGFTFKDEDYILEVPQSELNFNIDETKKIIGLNTGCGGRWTSRLWAEDNWVKLARILLSEGYEVILLGGAQEHEKNLRLAKESGAKYFGHFPLGQFIKLIDQCNLVVTAVTMAMHIAVGLKKKLILFNNIFNRNEFYLYNRGIILEPEFECDCYYAAECPNNCMQYIYPERVAQETIRLLDCSDKQH